MNARDWAGFWAASDVYVAQLEAAQADGWRHADCDHAAGYCSPA